MVHDRRLVPAAVALVLLSGCGVVETPAIRASPMTAPGSSAAEVPQSSTETTSAPSESSPAPTPATPTTSSKSPTGGESPTEVDWETLAERVSSSVVRLQIGTCDGDASSMGSGFVLDDHLVMTAAHVVADAPTITVRSDQVLTAARVIDYDYATDSALLYTDASFGGQTVELSTRPLALGRELAVLGYPLWVNELRMSTGVVSGLDETAEYPEFTVEHVFTTDAATNGGNSGGPVFDHRGKVIGLVSGGRNWSGTGDERVPAQGINYLVPAETLAQQFDAWSVRRPPEQDSCSGGAAPVEDDHFLDVTVSADHPDAEDVAQTLFLHGQGINDGNYEAAWSVFGPSLQRRFPLADWQRGLGTSYWEALELLDVTGDGDQLVAQTRFRTKQDAEFGREGQTCSDWRRNYTMVRIEGTWRIKATSGADPTPC